MSNLLNDTQIKMLEELGVLEAIVEAIKEPKQIKFKIPKGQTPPEEYMLEVEQSCTLCKTVRSRLYWMKRSELNPMVLSSELVPMNELENHTALPYMLEQRTVQSCGNCREFLMDKTKTELVSIILRGRKLCISG